MDLYTEETTPQRATSTACYPVYKYISNTLDAIRSKAWLYLGLAKRVHIGNSKPRNSFRRTRRPRTNRRQANAQLRHDGRRTLIDAWANLNGKNVSSASVGSNLITEHITRVIITPILCVIRNCRSTTG